MNQNFRGERVCPSPRNEKGNAIWQISRSRNNNPPPPPSPPLRKLSIYEDPLVWADSREKKGSPTVGGVDGIRVGRSPSVSLHTHLSASRCAAKDVYEKRRKRGRTGEGWVLSIID